MCDITFSHVAKDKKGVIEAGHIWKYDPKSGKTTNFRSPSGAPPLAQKAIKLARR
jgi:hypothetical protein